MEEGTMLIKRCQYPEHYERQKNLKVMRQESSRAFEELQQEKIWNTKQE